MILKEFLALLTPEEGFKFAQYGANPNHYITASTTDSLADQISHRDSQNTNVWFAPAAFEKKEYTDGEGKTRRRTQENAIGAKCLWLDIDAGESKAAKGKGYPTQMDALSAVSAFCKSTGLPLPLRVDSGNGIHCYWPLTKTLRAQTWNKLANAIDKLVKAHGLLADSSRTKDISSLLRPVETHNRKNPDYPKMVKVVGLNAEITDPMVLGKLLLDQVEQAPMLGAAPKALATAINDDLAMPVGDYPDVDAGQLAEGCAQIRFFRDTGSDDYAQWFRAIGVVKHAVNGEAVCHEWSAKSGQYSDKETQFKIDEWKTGPATCAAFEDYNGLCGSCPHSGKIASPIRLGFINKTVVEIVTDDVDPEHIVEQRPTTSLELPEPYSLDHQNRLCVTIKKMIKPAKGTPPGTPPTYEEETYPFCDVFFYPADRIEQEDGEMQQRIRARIREKWKEFVIPTHLIAGGKDLHKALAKYEVVVRGPHKALLDDYLVAFTNKLRQMKESIQSHRTFGWQQNGGLIIGDRMYEEGKVKPIVLGTANATAAAKHLVPTGSVEDWTDAVDRAYNHPNHEQFQFVIYAGFGSLLVHLLNYNASTVLSLYGGRGQGKTTAAKVALSIYGDPERMGTTWKTGSTFKANLLQIATLKSLPYLIDEFSNAKGEELSNAAYAFANGKARDTSSKEQELKSSGDVWCNTTIVTTNTSLHDVLAGYKDDASAEISRIVEVEWRNHCTVMNKNEMMDIYDCIVRNRGTAGDRFAKYVTKNREACESIVRKLMDSVDKTAGFTNETRFWSLLVATTLAGGYIATKLGLLNFKFEAVRAYGTALGIRHIAKVPTVTTSPLESFHTMLTAYSNRIITTATEQDRNGAFYDIKVTGDPMGRVLMEDGLGYFAINAIREWCTKKSIGFDLMCYELKRAGILLDENVKYYIGKGTKLSTGQMRCWMIDWSMINANAKAPVAHLQLVK